MEVHNGGEAFLNQCLFYNVGHILTLQSMIKRLPDSFLLPFECFYFLFLLVQRAEQEPHTSGGGPDLPGSVQPRSSQIAKKHHQQTD